MHDIRQWWRDCVWWQGKLGELLLSLCYQPNIGRLTVIVMKAKELKAKDITGSSGNVPHHSKAMNRLMIWTSCELTCCATPTVSHADQIRARFSNIMAQFIVWFTVMMQVKVLFSVMTHATFCLKRSKGVKLNELGRQKLNKAKFVAAGEACETVFWPTPGLKVADLGPQQIGPYWLCGQKPTVWSYVVRCEVVRNVQEQLSCLSFV